MITSLELLNLERQVSECVVAAARLLEARWQQQKSVHYKEGADPVTEFDISIEQELRAKLGELLPGAGYIVEEGQTNEAGLYDWVIDPIDQTKNFVGLVPLFFIQVALLQHGVPVLGVIYNPLSQQLFSASRGNGAKLNGQTMPHAPNVTLDGAIIDVDFGDSSGLAWKMGVVEKLAELSFRLRITGGAYAVHLLTGGIHAFVVVNEKTKPVDQLPRIAIMREAGFVVEERELGGRVVTMAGSQGLIREIVSVLR